MILSYNAPQNKEDSSEGSVKDENFQEIKAIINDKKKPAENNKTPSFQNSSDKEEPLSFNSDSDQKSQGERRNFSVSSSLQGLSRGEDCIQKDIMEVIDDDSVKKGLIELNDSEFLERKSSYGDEKIIDVSRDKSVHSQKSKNYILKSTLMSSKEPGNAKTNKEAVRLNANNTANQNNFTSFVNTIKPYYLEDKHDDYVSSYSHYQGSLTPSKEYYPVKLQQDNYSQNAFMDEANVSKLTQQVNYLSIGLKPQTNKALSNDYSISNSGKVPFSTNCNAIDEKKAPMMKPSKNRYEIPNDTDLITNCVRYCKEQAGCRLLQRKLEEYPAIASDIFYPNIKAQMIELACDPFGNYFIQKIISCLSVEKLEEFILRQLPNSFRMMSFSPHGTRVIQKIFESVLSNPKLLNYYTLLLKPNINDFIIDVNASHIIIQYVSLVSSPLNDFLIEYLTDHIYDLAIQKHSCCALQKCIEYVNEEQKLILYQAVAQSSFKLFTDQYGNYVVQFVISAGNYEVNHVMMVNFLKDFENFCVQKFSSNVIEKCLSYCSDETKQMIVKSLCNPQLVQRLLYDSYGNYGKPFSVNSFLVLQKGMSLAKDPYRAMLFEYVGPHMEKLSLLSFGPKLYNRLLASFQELMPYVKNDKALVMQKKLKPSNNGNLTSVNSNMTNANSNMTIGPNMSQAMMYPPPIHSFHNYGNVYYQTNPLYNQYTNRYAPIQRMSPMNNLMNPQFYQQGLSSQGMFMPFNYQMNTPPFPSKNQSHSHSQGHNADTPSNGNMNENISFYNN